MPIGAAHEGKVVGVVQAAGLTALVRGSYQYLEPSNSGGFKAVLQDQISSFAWKIRILIWSVLIFKWYWLTSKTFEITHEPNKQLLGATCVSWVVSSWSLLWAILTRNALNLLLQNLLMCILIKRILEALHEDPDECAHLCCTLYIVNRIICLLFTC